VKHSASLFLALFMAMLFVGCQVEIPSGVIGKGKMERILYDYHIAQGMAEAQHGDVMKYRYIYIQKVFEKHHVTQAEFDSSMVWYSAHASLLQDIYDKLDEKMSYTSNKMGIVTSEAERYATMSEDGDTARVWSSENVLVLAANPVNNLYNISLRADSTYRPGDYFQLSFDNHFLVSDNHRECYASLTINYEGGKSVSATTRVGGDYIAKCYMAHDTTTAQLAIQSVDINFYLPYDPVDSHANRVLIVSKPALIRYHYLDPKPIAVDSLEDSSIVDTIVSTQTPSSGPRLTPEQMRKSQPNEKKVNVIQGKKEFAPGTLRPSTRGRRRNNISR